MAFARGDLARRAALADNLAVPEPWGANDDPRVFAAIRDLRDEFRQLGITDEDGKGRLPDFLIDYENLPPIKPVALDRAHTRNSSATRWDQNGNLVEEPSDTLRLQRDPATQEPLGLLYEPQRTQLLSTPQDLTLSWTATNVKLNANVGSAKGQDYDAVTEDSSSGAHAIKDSISTSTDDPVGLSAIVKANGRPKVKLLLLDTGNGNAQVVADISGASVTDTTSSNTTIISTDAKDLGGGWARVEIAAKPPSSGGFDEARIRLAKSDGTDSYTGDGTSGIFVMHAQAEVSREVTTPILTGSATRGADAVDYRFSFPDRTTGVAFSIKQEAGSEYNSFGYVKPGPLFGTTPLSNKRHGVLFYGKGVNRNFSDGWESVARNADDDAGNVSVEDETIDRFEVDYSTSEVAFIIRQITIHTRPHTQAQKNALADQYLTQP